MNVSVARGYSPVMYATRSGAGGAASVVGAEVSCKLESGEAVVFFSSPRLRSTASISGTRGFHPSTSLIFRLLYFSGLNRAWTRHGMNRPGNRARLPSSILFVSDASRATDRITVHDTGTIFGRGVVRSRSRFT